MKPYTWLMSKILSPGAFAVWHSMGDPEEWKYDKTNSELHHKTTGLSVHAAHRNSLKPIQDGDDLVIFIICAPLMFFFSSFTLDCTGQHKGAIGYLERHLIYGRACRLIKYLTKPEHKKKRRERNRAVFALLTVNERVKT